MQRPILFFIILCHCLVIQTSLNPITGRAWNTGRRLLSVDGEPSQDVVSSKSSVIQQGKYYRGSSNEGEDVKIKHKRRDVGDSLDVEEGDDDNDKIRSNIYLNAEHNPHIKVKGVSHVKDSILNENTRDSQLLLKEDAGDRETFEGGRGRETIEDGRDRETSAHYRGYDDNDYGDDDDNDGDVDDYGDKSVSSSAYEVRSIPFDDDDDEWEDDDDDDTDTSEEYRAKALPFDDDHVSGFDFDGDDDDDETDTSEENRRRGMPFDDDDIHEEAYYEDD